MIHTGTAAQAAPELPQGRAFPAMKTPYHAGDGAGVPGHPHALYAATCRSYKISTTPPGGIISYEFLYFCNCSLVVSLSAPCATRMWARTHAATGDAQSGFVDEFAPGPFAPPRQAHVAAAAYPSGRKSPPTHCAGGVPGDVVCSYQAHAAGPTPGPGVVVQGHMEGVAMFSMAVHGFVTTAPGSWHMLSRPHQRHGTNRRVVAVQAPQLVCTEHFEAPTPDRVASNRQARHALIIPTLHTVTVPQDPPGSHRRSAKH